MVRLLQLNFWIHYARLLRYLLHFLDVMHVCLFVFIPEAMVPNLGCVEISPTHQIGYLAKWMSLSHPEVNPV